MKFVQRLESVVIPPQLPILPVKDLIVFPLMVTPIFFTNEKDLKAINDSMASNNLIGLVVQKNSEGEYPSPKDLYSVGTASRILQLVKLEGGGIKMLVEGLSRIKIISYTREEPYLLAEIEDVREFHEKNTFIEALVQSVSALFKMVISIGKSLPDDIVSMIDKIDNPARLADLICVYLSLTIEEQQKVLETFDPLERLSKVFIYLNKEVQILQVRGKIQSEVAKELSKTQREYLLRQQLKAIQKELGEDDPHISEINELKKRIEEADMPEKVQGIAEKELSRLEKMNPVSAEYTVSRTYIDYLITVPWRKQTEDNLDIEKAENVLNEDHYGLKKVKERILEYLAVRTLRKSMKGPILCFVGPPGVGKTSLGRSIARAMERKFIRISLGGMRDEAEIRGHRRTYVGALPGRIIQEIRRAEVCNPVFMLDEVDKMGQDFRGDPASALLEVLDPEQNFSFSDHYLDVPYDLSNVMFITTANILDPIPFPLKDRMEIIFLSGYTEEEKEKIAFQYLIPRQIEENGLKEYPISFEVEAIYKIIREYTKEAGLRNLEREIASVCRKVAKEITQKRKGREIITPKEVEEFLGPRKFFFEVAEEHDRIGVSTGLAWTETGGDIIFIEATKMKGKKELILTGSLGEVMKESAHAALSYIRSHVKEIDIPNNFYEQYDLHIHVPSGAIPKDGPSAGITIAIAVISLLTDKPARHDVAMTGELTLTGRVLPIGGIKEKILAARRAGVKSIIMPEKNKKDLEDIPDYIRNEMSFIFVKNIEEVIKNAF
ncbi:MAG: endopeptidase La [Nitrospinota bacterium]